MKPALAFCLLVACLAVACSTAGNSAAPNPEPPATSAGPDVGASDNPDDASAVQATRVVITSTLALETHQVRPAYDEIGRLAATFGGHVAEGSVAGSDARPSAHLRLRVPAPRESDFAGAVRRLDGVRVLREEIQTKEVTAAFADLEARLANLRRSEAQYQEILAKAQTIPDVLQVSGRLDSVRADVEQNQGRLNLLNDQTDLATFDISLSSPANTAKSRLPSPVQALHAALEVSQALAQLAAGALVAVGVIFLWLIPLALVVVLAWRLVGRHAKAIVARMTLS